MWSVYYYSRFFQLVHNYLKIIFIYCIEINKQEQLILTTLYLIYSYYKYPLSILSILELLKVIKIKNMSYQFIVNLLLVSNTLLYELNTMHSNLL